MTVVKSKKTSAKVPVKNDSLQKKGNKSKNKKNKKSKKSLFTKNDSVQTYFGGIEEVTSEEILNFYNKNNEVPETESKKDSKPVTTLNSKQSSKRKRNTVEETDSKSYKDETTDISSNDVVIDEGAWRRLGVSGQILKNVNSLGFEKPTQIQERVIGEVINNLRCVVAASETGSGKTLAYVIPILHGILKDMKNKDDSEDEGEKEEEDVLNDKDLVDPESNKKGCVKVINNVKFDFLESDARTPDTPSKKPKALIITPTRELAKQVQKHAQNVLVNTGVRCISLVGGLAVSKQERQLRQQPEIIIGTPGRIWELVNGGNTYLSHLPGIKWLVMDEADRMSNLRDFKELGQLLKWIRSNEKMTSRRQSFMLSATLPLKQTPQDAKRDQKRNESDSAEKLQLMRRMLAMSSKPLVIDLTRDGGTVETLTERRVYCDEGMKDAHLYLLLATLPGRSLVFAKMTNVVRRLLRIFSLLKLPCKGLHGRLLTKERLDHLDWFRNAQSGVLVATDVAGRGIDVPAVDRVIHYDVPGDVQTYIHRCGRTARANVQGESVVLCAPMEVRHMRSIFESLGRAESDVAALPVRPAMLDAAIARTEFADDLDTMTEARQKDCGKGKWLESTSKRFGMEIDPRISRRSDIQYEDVAFANRQKEKRHTMYLHQKRVELDRILKIPMVDTSKSRHNVVSNAFSKTRLLDPNHPRNQLVKDKPRFRGKRQRHK